MRFLTDKLKPADILAGRNEVSKFGKQIRAALGSYTNHNALFLHHNTRNEFLIGDTTAPLSKYAPLSEYENLVNSGTYAVRVWRVVGMEDDMRQHVSYSWQRFCDGVPYADHSIAKLLVFRLVNNIPWQLRIHGTWCTLNTIMAFRMTDGALDPSVKPNGSKKNNPTPRTLENRLVAGILEDVTDQVTE